jgi:hypothetical protein
MTLLGDVGVSPVVEVGIGVTGVAPRCGMPFFGSRGIGVHGDAPEDDVVQEVRAGRCPFSTPCWLARSRDSDHRSRVGLSGVAETPLFNNVRTTNSSLAAVNRMWRACQPTTARCAIGRLAVPNATLDNELQPVK